MREYNEGGKSCKQDCIFHAQERNRQKRAVREVFLRSVQKWSNFCEKRMPKGNVHASTLSEEWSFERKGRVFPHFLNIT
jgi:hypothetical protein